VNAFLKAKEKVDVESLDEESVPRLRGPVHEVLMATLGNPGYTKQGLRLADVYMNMRDRDVVKAKEGHGIHRGGEQHGLPPEHVDKKTVRWSGQPSTSRQDAHNNLGVMQHLEVVTVHRPPHRQQS
jgi:hypothetical protein